MFDPNDLVHLNGELISLIHDDILEEQPGLKGTRPDLSVDAIVGRIQTNFDYEIFSAIEEVAALYAEAIAKGHVFLDGNKRTALISMLMFLSFNNYGLLSEEDDLADKIEELGNGVTSFREFAVWLKPFLVHFDQLDEE